MTTKLSQQFGSNLRHLRGKKRLTQPQLATQLGVSKGIVAKWEKGLASPSVDNATRVADFFGVTLAALLGKAESAEPDFRAAEELIKKWSPALAAIKDAVHSVVQEEEAANE